MMAEYNESQLRRLTKDDREKQSFKIDENSEISNIVWDAKASREAAIANNLKMLELLGISLDNYVVADDEIISLSDGTLIKAGA